MKMEQNDLYPSQENTNTSKTILQKVYEISKPVWNKWLKRTTQIILIVIITIGGLFWISLYVVPFLQETAFIFTPQTHKEYITDDSKSFEKFKDKIVKSTIKLQRKLDSNTPNTAYMIINTTENTFLLYTGKKLVRKGVCSTGSYTLLKVNDEKQYIFKTPRGVRRVHGKTTYPVWKKPDWAFIEEGLPVPPANHDSRFEYGTLGDYALSIGDGYLIHGTLYQRLLGLPVTHGCVRLNDADLEAVYNTLNIGSKVIIY